MDNILHSKPNILYACAIFYTFAFRLSSLCVTHVAKTPAFKAHLKVEKNMQSLRLISYLKED